MKGLLEERAQYLVSAKYENFASQPVAQEINVVCLRLFSSLAKGGFSL